MLHSGTRCVTERVISSPCFISSTFHNLFCRFVGSRLCDCSVRPHRVAWLQWMKPEWQIAWLQSPKILAFTEAIARKYVHLRARAGEKREFRVLRSLFCKFKTLVSFPEAAAFAWLDQADLGLSRRPRPSPLDASSASHATCSTRGAVPRRTARVPGESTHSPGGSGQRWAARITQNKCIIQTLTCRTFSWIRSRPLIP